MNQTELIDLVSRGLYYSTVIAVVVSVAAYVSFRLRERGGRRASSAELERIAPESLDLFEAFRFEAVPPPVPARPKARILRRIGIGWGVGAVAVVSGGALAVFVDGDAEVAKAGRGAAEEAIGPSLLVAGSGGRGLPAAWRSVMNVADGSPRPVSLFGIPELDENGDGTIQSAERARIHARVPQFILVGVDDNGAIEGIRWLREVFEAYGIWSHATFFMTANYLSGRKNYLGGPIEDVWQAVARDNFVGLHGTTHAPGAESWGVERWRSELVTVQEELRARLLPPDRWEWGAYPWGSRAPFLVYNDAYFEALDGLAARVVFDSSVQVRPAGADERSFEVSSARDLPWPFRLDAPLTAAILPPDHVDPDASLEPHEIWEVPVTTWLYPPREGSSARWEPSFDFNLWQHFGCDDPKGNKRVVDFVVANLRGHLNGNRAPFTIGVHAEQFVPGKVCHRRTFERLFARIQGLRIDGYDIRYVDMPELLLWMEGRR